MRVASCCSLSSIAAAAAASSSCTSSYTERNFKQQQQQNSRLLTKFKPTLFICARLHSRTACNSVTNLEVRVSETQEGEESVKERLDKFGSQEDDEEKSISRIAVPRQRYIPVPKTDLLRALASLFTDEKEAQQFLHICSCLDCILHAEHKHVLEQMRIDYGHTHAHIHGGKQYIVHDGYDFPWSVGNGGISCSEGSVVNKYDDRRYIQEAVTGETDLGTSLTRSGKNLESRSSKDDSSNLEDASVISAGRFQNNFMQLLRNAEFQELSVQDLQLSSALNSDYLLTLPIDVDWKGASSSTAIIFRRGYTTEKQEGLLLGEKLDYLQSKILQNLFGNLSQPVVNTGLWINQKWENLDDSTQLKSWINAIKLWLKEPLKQNRKHSRSIKYNRRWFQDNDRMNLNKSENMPISVASQEAVPRYEKFLSSAGSRGRLLKRFLVWIGILPLETPVSILDESHHGFFDPYKRVNFLSRVSLKDIWKPASKEACKYNVWRQIQATLSVIFSRSVLQEPAFKELVLLYSGPADEERDGKSYMSSILQLKIYNRIPLPDLKVIFPNKKLSFRILDTVRLDIATILGLLAYFINYKFESIFVSLSAFVLDLIAFGALIVFLTRVVLGYKQTWDRYQLLVNRTLYEKTLASGYGTVHYLVDASEQQQLKEAILVYAILLQDKQLQMDNRQRIASACEKFIFNNFSEKIEMAIDKALETLLRLGILIEDIAMKKVDAGERTLYKIKVVPYEKACKTLESQWSELLYQH